MCATDFHRSPISQSFVQSHLLQLYLQVFGGYISGGKTPYIQWWRESAKNVFQGFTTDSGFRSELWLSFFLFVYSNIFTVYVYLSYSTFALSLLDGNPKPQYQEYLLQVFFQECTLFSLTHLHHQLWATTLLWLMKWMMLQPYVLPLVSPDQSTCTHVCCVPFTGN